MKASDIIGKFRFTRNSDSGGSGGVSDEVKGSVINLKTSLGATWSGSGYTPYPLASNNIRIPIDENNCIDALRDSGRIIGLRILPVSLNNNILNISEGDTIDLNLGENTPTVLLDKQYIKIADDKSFVIFSITGALKFFYIPLNKSGNTYTFGTPIEMDIESTYVQMTIIDSTTFAAYQSAINKTKILIIKLENDTLSIVKTIDERYGGVLEAIGNKLVTTHDLKFAVYDITSGERVYLDTDLEHMVYRFVKIGNKVISFQGGNAHGLEINGDSVQPFECSYDKPFRVEGMRYYLAKKLSDDDYLFIYSEFENFQKLFAFCFKFSQNKMFNNISILNNVFINDPDGAVMVDLVNILILGYAYGSILNIYDSEIITNKVISLKYQNDTFGISSLGE